MPDKDSSPLLQDKVLFIAGVGPLMGEATARIAAREGARVALAARSQETIEKLAADDQTFFKLLQSWRYHQSQWFSIDFLWVRKIARIMKKYD